MCSAGGAQVFCETKRGCDEVTRKLRLDGWPALSIHGDKSQQERDWVLAVRFLPASPAASLSRESNMLEARVTP